MDCVCVCVKIGTPPKQNGGWFLEMAFINKQTVAKCVGSPNRQPDSPRIGDFLRGPRFNHNFVSTGIMLCVVGSPILRYTRILQCGLCVFEHKKNLVCPKEA